MTQIATILVTAAAVPSGIFSGSGPATPSVSMKVQSGRIVQASAWTSVFNCELGGNIGPASVSVTPGAAIRGDGSVRFASGPKRRRLHANLRYSRGRLTGRIQLTGLVGGPCSSPVIPVSLRRH